MMKTVLITGADRGIGYSLCECFIEGGWYVIAGQYMPEWPQLSALAEKYPEIIQEVRGTGLMLAVEFHTCELGYETAKGLFARRVMTAGTLVNAKTIRFEPTAVISEQDIKDVISRMDEALADTKKALNV